MLAFFKSHYFSSGNSQVVDLAPDSECSTILHSSWIFTLWTLDRLISDNEVGASSRTLGCCALLRVGPCGSRIVDPPPLLGTRVGRVGRGFRTSDLPVLCPFPSERPRTPDLGSRIEWLAPHTVGAKPDPGLWISPSSDSGPGAHRRCGSRILDSGWAPDLTSRI